MHQVRQCLKAREKEKVLEHCVPGPAGGDDGDRTHYLLNAIQALSQMSYTPIGMTIILVLTVRGQTVFSQSAKGLLSPFVYLVGVARVELAAS